MKTNPLTFGWNPGQKYHEEQGSVNSLGSLPNGPLRKPSLVQKKRLIDPFNKVERVLSLISYLEKTSKKK